MAQGAESFMDYQIWKSHISHVIQLMLTKPLRGVAKSFDPHHRKCTTKESGETRKIEHIVNSKINHGRSATDLESIIVSTVQYIQLRNCVQVRLFQHNMRMSAISGERKANTIPTPFPCLCKISCIPSFCGEMHVRRSATPIFLLL